MFGLTTRKHFPGSRKCLITALKTTSFHESSSCVVISQANLLLMVMGEMFKCIKVCTLYLLFWTLSHCFLLLDNFDALADLIASYPIITRSTHFVFVPGPLDITINSTLPRRQLLTTLTGKLKTKVHKVHFASNPCRIKFFDQEIVIFREDLMARMLRNVVGVKPDVKSEDLKRFVNFPFLYFCDGMC